MASTTRLAGVNEVLRSLGQAPVSELRETRAATLVEDMMSVAARELQTKGWWFNRARYTPTLTPLGWAHLPERFILDEGQNDSRVALRDGRRLYDRDNRTYVWGTVTNLLADPDDLSSGAWVPASLTVGSKHPTVLVPGGEANAAWDIENTGVGGRVAQGVSLSSLTAGKRYMLGAYVGANASTVLDPTGQPAVVRGYDSTAGVRFGVELTFDIGPSTDTFGDTGWSRRLENALESESIPVMSAQGSNQIIPEWRLGTAIFTPPANNFEFQVWPTSASGSTLFVWQPFIVEAETFPLGELRVIEVLDYEDMPTVAQQWVARRTAVEAGSVLMADRELRNHNIRREFEAMAALQRAENRENRITMLEHSPNARARAGRGHGRPVQEMLHTYQRPGTDV